MYPGILTAFTKVFACAIDYIHTRGQQVYPVSEVNGLAKLSTGRADRSSEGMKHMPEVHAVSISTGMYTPDRAQIYNDIRQAPGICR